MLYVRQLSGRSPSSEDELYFISFFTVLRLLWLWVIKFYAALICSLFLELLLLWPLGLLAGWPMMRNSGGRRTGATEESFYWKHIVSTHEGEKERALHRNGSTKRECCTEEIVRLIDAVCRLCSGKLNS